MSLPNYIRLFAALLFAKIYIKISSLVGLRGSTMPGAIALRIFPGITAYLASQVPYLLLVTGTNGKTSTNNMIVDILETAGCKTIANREGANLATGIATALIKGAGVTGRTSCDIACLEVDEAAFPALAGTLKPEMVVFTNFFKDQLDRFGEIKKTVLSIQESLQSLSAKPFLVLNADDPLAANIGGSGYNSLYFSLSLEREVYGPGNISGNGRLCPRCGHPLVYKSYNYSQLGDYRCYSCSFKRPQGDVSALVDNRGDSELQMEVYSKGEIHQIVLPAKEIYSAYNALAALAAGRGLKIGWPALKNGIEKSRQISGRMEWFSYRDQRICLNLVKNPAGLTESLKALATEPGRKDLLLVLNDRGADGRDISWIWDVDLEMLLPLQDTLGILAFSGSRGAEMALRCKYAGLDMGNSITETDLSKAVSVLITGRKTTAYLFTSYTALWPVRNMITKLGAKEQTDVKSTSSLSRTP